MKPGEYAARGITRIRGDSESNERYNLIVTVHSATKVARSRLFQVGIDPYAELALDGFSCRTKHIRSTVNPVWEETFRFVVFANDMDGKVLYVKVKDSGVI